MPSCPAGHDSASSDFCDVCGIRIDAAGVAVTPPSVESSSSAAVQPATALPPPADASAERCPQCGAVRSGRFCETCGRDFETGAGAETSRPVMPGSSPMAARGVQATGGAAGEGGASAEGVPPAAGSGPAAGGAGHPVTGPLMAGRQAPDWMAVASSDRTYYEGVIAAGGPDAATVEFPAYCPERRFRLTGKEMRIGRHSASRGLYPEIDLTGPPTDPGVSRLHAVLIAQPDGGWAVVDPGSENGTLVNGTEIAAGAQVMLHDGDRIHVGAWTVITIHAG